MEATKSEGSDFVIFKFAPNILRHLPPGHLLQKNPNIANHLSEEMKIVGDVMKGLGERFAIGIKMKIVGQEDTLFLPDLPATALTHLFDSKSFRVEADEIPRKISVVTRAWRALSSMTPPFPGLTSNQAGRKRLALNPAPSSPVKRQRPTVTQGQNESPAGHAEEAAENLVPNAIQPEMDSPESLTSPGQPPSTSTSQETARSLSGQDKKGSWSPASYEDVEPGQIIELKIKDEKAKELFVDFMRVQAVKKDAIRGFGLIDFTCLNSSLAEDVQGFVNKSLIQGIKMLKVNGEAVNEQDNGTSWSLGEYEEVKAGQIVELKVKYAYAEKLCTYIMRVMQVEEDAIIGISGAEEWREPKYEIQQIKILKMDGDVVYE